MDRSGERPSAPNFTNAFLVMAGVLLFMALFTAYAFYGFIGVALLAIGTDRGVIRNVPVKIRERA